MVYANTENEETIMKSDRKKREAASGDAKQVSLEFWEWLNCACFKRQSLPRWSFLSRVA